MLNMEMEVNGMTKSECKEKYKQILREYGALENDRLFLMNLKDIFMGDMRNRENPSKLNEVFTVKIQYTDKDGGEWTIGALQQIEDELERVIDQQRPLREDLNEYEYLLCGKPQVGKRNFLATWIKCGKCGSIELMPLTRLNYSIAECTMCGNKQVLAPRSQYEVLYVDAKTGKAYSRGELRKWVGEDMLNTKKIPALLMILPLLFLQGNLWDLCMRILNTVT